MFFRYEFYRMKKRDESAWLNMDLPDFKAPIVTPWVLALERMAHGPDKVVRRDSWIQAD